MHDTRGQRNFGTGMIALENHLPRKLNKITASAWQRRKQQKRIFVTLVSTLMAASVLLLRKLNALPDRKQSYN